MRAHFCLTYNSRKHGTVPLKLSDRKVTSLLRKHAKKPGMMDDTTYHFPQHRMWINLLANFQYIKIAVSSVTVKDAVCMS